MALNSNITASFNNQDDFMYNLGFVEGVREIYDDTRIFPIDYESIVGIEDRIVEDYNNLPAPGVTPEGEYWIVTQQRSTDTYDTPIQIKDVSPNDPEPGDGNVVYSKDNDGNVTIIINTTQVVVTVQEITIDGSDQFEFLDQVEDRYVTIVNNDIENVPSEVIIYYSTTEGDHENGMYEVLGGEWVLYDDRSLYTNLVPKDFKDQYPEDVREDILTAWIQDKGFELNTYREYTYDSGLVNYSIVTKSRDYAMMVTWGYFLIQEGFYTADQLKSMTRSEILAEVEDKLAPITESYTIEGEDVAIFKYLDITEDYMFVEGSSSLKHFLNSDSLVGDLRYKYLSFNLDGSLDEDSCEFERMLILTGLEKNVKSMEEDLQRTIIEDDSNREVMQSIWDDIEVYKNQVSDMYADAEVKEKQDYVSDNIINITPLPVDYEDVSHEGYEVAFYDGSQDDPVSAEKYILIKTHYPILNNIDTSIVELSVICQDSTTISLSDISSTYITIVSNPDYPDNPMFRIDIDPSDPWPSGANWYPNSVSVTYLTEVSLQGWSEDNPPPPVFVKDASDSTRLGYRFLRTNVIYKPDSYEQYPFPAPADPDSDEYSEYYLNQYPYDERVDSWYVETDGHNEEFITENKSYFEALYAPLADVFGPNWSCSAPLNLYAKDEITEVDSTNKVFTVSGDKASNYTNGTTITVVGSTGNNGAYTVTLALYDAVADDTNITVAEAVPSALADGYIALYYDTVDDFLNDIEERFGVDNLSDMFENSKELRERPQDTEEYVDGSFKETKRPSGLRAEIIGLCDSFDGVYVSQREDILSQHEHSTNVINFFGT